VEALTFMLRRLSVDPVIAVVIYRAPAGRLDEVTQRMLGSAGNRVRIPLGGLGPDEVASLAAAFTAGSGPETRIRGTWASQLISEMGRVVSLIGPIRRHGKKVIRVSRIIRA
jgi:hypothetical protein